MCRKSKSQTQETSVQIFTEVTSLVISKLVNFTPRQTQVPLTYLISPHLPPDSVRMGGRTSPWSRDKPLETVKSNSSNALIVQEAPLSSFVCFVSCRFGCYSSFALPESNKVLTK